MIICISLVIISVTIFLSDIVKINKHFRHPRIILRGMATKNKQKTGRKPIFGKAMPKFYIRLPANLIKKLKKAGTDRVRDYLDKF